ncbi:MAG: hypothetical protein J0H14_04885 [Alphaproteobacteria bacterium]|nr:hypothetical protein [Alphaproteobacteria bacterium]
MIDHAHPDQLHQLFTSLLHELSAAWPKQDLEYVLEEIDHGEYEDALENLIALGLRNGRGFGPDGTRQVEALAAAMGMENSSFVGQLRKT